MLLAVFLMRWRLSCHVLCQSCVRGVWEGMEFGKRWWFRGFRRLVAFTILFLAARNIPAPPLATGHAFRVNGVVDEMYTKKTGAPPAAPERATRQRTCSRFCKAIDCIHLR